MTSPEPKTAANRRSERVRHLEITTSCPKELTKKALTHFNLDDEELLKVEVIKQGRKKFIVFGPRHTTYRVEVRPIFKRLLQPFLKGLFEMANLELEARVSFRDPQVRVSIAGNDAGLLFRDRCQLLDALDTVIRRYLGQKLNLEENIKILVEGPRREDRVPRQETQESSEGQAERNAPRRDNNRRDGKRDRFDKERGPRRDNRDGARREHRPNPRENELIELARKYEREITEKQQPILIQALTAADRRIIHQYFQDHPDIITTSLGEGQIKTIELSLK